MSANSRKAALHSPPPVPTWVGEVELTRSISPLTVPERPGCPYEQSRLLIRLDHRPIGYLNLPAGSGTELPAETVAGEIWNHLSEQIRNYYEGGNRPTGEHEGGNRPTGEHEGGNRPLPESLPVHGLAPRQIESAQDADAPLISVVLCTRNRPEGAARTLESLCAMHYEPFEIIVVDNASDDDSTGEIIRTRSWSEKINYVYEPRSGLSYARNRGLAEAKGTIIAFTDDDVIVDAWWLNGILEGFRRYGDVGCVTGIVPSAALDNAVQHYFDRRTTWGGLLQPRRFDMREHRDLAPIYPYAPGTFGTGANFAFDATTIRDVGGFDEALGAGSPAGGGEDLDAFIKVLRSGKALVQEPSAVIWHVHRSDVAQLNRQMFYYGAGLSAFVTKQMCNTTTALEVAKRFVPAVRRIRSIAVLAGDQRVLPKSIWAIERLGIVYGPFAYARGAIRRRRIGRSTRISVQQTSSSERDLVG